MKDFRKLLVLPSAMAVLMMASFIGVGCAKKVALAPPPPQPAPTVAAATRTPADTGIATPAPAPAAQAPPVATNSRYPDKATRDRIDALLARISDAYFDYDQHTLRPDAVSTLQSDSVELRDILKQYPDYRLVIEGHADERGSEEYNLGLADERAVSAKNFLVQVGIPSQQISVVSYGKDKPVCQDHNESCWQKNRRIHIIPAANQPA
ncbi:MAG TPA: OmpA family protein [Bryobacteraceae bacterium]|jgi:peptidoglycan-associated lipoprotein